MFLSFKWHWFHSIPISGLGDIIETVSLFPLEKLCAENIYIYLNYLEAELLLGSMMKVVGNSLQMFKMYLFTAFFWQRETLLISRRIHRGDISS